MITFDYDKKSRSPNSLPKLLRGFMFCLVLFCPVLFCFVVFVFVVFVLLDAVLPIAISTIIQLIITWILFLPFTSVMNSDVNKSVVTPEWKECKQYEV